ncbi:trehalose operon repressor [Streptococcus merionis]|uniref:trehalose operon repressor n=1 Tax=Streptococcus merionis TaxID=400065 RepID=UPI0026ECB14F|nr:trehalose operon repressor [Streptococcus merionis]
MKKYQEIFNDLRDKITKGHYAPNELLPTEQNLRKIYDVSRDTVRKALSLLTEAGLIQKIQGRGSVVIKQEQVDFPVSGLTSYQELVETQGLHSKTEVISFELLTIDSHLALLTGFKQHSKAWKVVRTRALDGKVAVLDTDYLSYDFAPQLSREIAAKSIYAYLEDDLQLDISYAQKEITVEPSSQEERELMQNKDDFLVLIKSRVFLGNAQQFQYTESRHKLDKFKFVEFARRKHSL